MPRGVRKTINFDDEILKIESQIQELTAKRDELRSKKTESEMKVLSRFILENNMSAADAIAILSPAIAASAQNPNADSEV